MVRTRFNRPTTISAPIGSGYDPVYEERIVEGKRKLVKVGENPLNEFVQKSLAETQIYNILRKFENGNVEILNKTVGQFMDVTGMPTSLAEAQNQIIRVNKYFDSLPLDVREKFGHNPNVFLEKVFDGSFVDLFPKKEPVLDSVKEDPDVS